MGSCINYLILELERGGCSFNISNCVGSPETEKLSGSISETIPVCLQVNNTSSSVSSVIINDTFFYLIFFKTVFKFQNIFVLFSGHVMICMPKPPKIIKYDTCQIYASGISKVSSSMILMGVREITPSCFETYLSVIITCDFKTA